MDWGCFNVMQQRHRSKAPKQIFNEVIEQTRFAEQLGFGRAWFVEHHFSNYSICPSPLTMAAHLAGMTETIRLGTAVVVAPLYQPPRLLAEIAMVDTLSDGRLDVGVGTGYQAFEFERFGLTLDNRSEKTIEVLEQVRAGLSNSTFSYDGEYYHQPNTAINVRPLQRPHPPIWLAGTDPNMHRAAAKYGFNIFLSGQLGSTRRLGRFLDGVKAVFREEGADPDTMNVALLRFGYVTDNKRDADQYVDGARYQQRLAVALKRRQEMVEDDYWVREVPYDDELPFAKMTDNIPVGSVEKCAELVANEIRTLGITHYVIQPQIGDVENAKSLRSMERWMTEVVPMVEKELGQPLATVNPQNDPSAIVP